MKLEKEKEKEKGGFKRTQTISLTPRINVSGHDTPYNNHCTNISKNNCHM
jgi:hypothetical protein